MKYQLTCLTPTLIGDGQELAPIDYMVWKDQVNVLDQRRIFKLFARGPRLDGYLAQLKRASKLDFASWGGLAQNYAGRRIPFEHPSLTQHWERTQPEHLFIRTFSANLTGGPFVPGTAIKGALRTGSVFTSWNDQAWQAIESAVSGDRVPRRLAAPVEDRLVRKVLTGVGASDSDPLAMGITRVFLLRTATLTGPKLELAWKRSPGGSARTAGEGTPAFVEMAAPGTAFQGSFRTPNESPKLFMAANKFAAGLLAGHLHYAETAKLPLLVQAITALKARADAMAESNSKTCLLPLGWGGGFLGKAALIDSNQEALRTVLKKLPFYQRALQTGMPFPKTRRIVFLNDQPATLAGWTLLEVE